MADERIDTQNATTLEDALDTLTLDGVDEICFNPEEIQDLISSFDEFGSLIDTNDNTNDDEENIAQLR